MAAHNDLGKWGEGIAMRYLDAKGYQLVAHDWKLFHKDIDIVAYDNTGMYVFVEVKTRSTSYRREMVLSPAKRWNLSRIIMAYCRAHQITRARVDLIVVIGSPESYTIEHVESVLIPMLTAPVVKRRNPWH